MSNIFGPILEDAYALITQSARSISTIIPDCPVEEVHRDELQVTMHPVATGTPITDHSFLMPQMVELRWGWSNSNAQAEGYVQAVYQELLTLQQSRQPFDVSTGKRQYNNMLLRSLQIRTDEASEFTLMGLAICQQVILTSVQTGASSTTSPNSDGSQQLSSAQVGTSGVGPSGLSVDANGNVYFPNGTAPNGTVQLQGGSLSPGVTAETFAQSQAAYSP